MKKIKSKPRKVPEQEKKINKEAAKRQRKMPTQMGIGVG